MDQVRDVRETELESFPLVVSVLPTHCVQGTYQEYSNVVFLTALLNPLILIRVPIWKSFDGDNRFEG